MNITQNQITECFISALKKGDKNSGIFVVEIEAAKKLLKKLNSKSSDYWGHAILTGVHISSYYANIEDGVSFKIIETSENKAIRFLPDANGKILQNC